MFEKEGLILFNHAPCGYHLIDEDGVIINMNDTMLGWLGYEREEIIGKKRFSDFIHADRDAADRMIATLAKNEEHHTEMQLTRKDGETFPVVMGTMSPEGFSDPAVRMFSTLDNSRCHEALERIKRLDQELEAFSYSISHDLRAPLRSIDGYSKILQEDYADQLDKEGQRVLNVVMNNARRMGNLIDDLLDFGRLGRKVLQRKPVNMAMIVNTVLQNLRDQKPDREIEVRIGDLLAASADADMMRQLWFNLLGNAFKYSGQEKVARIDVRSYMLGNREICYEIKDNGVGFDMQYAGKLFGIFQRLHKMQDFSGTGVGLAIVKRIVSRHGGRVWAQAAVGEGATFSFTLPVEE